MDRSAKILITAAVMFLVGAIVMALPLMLNVEPKTTLGGVGAAVMIVSICLILLGTVTKVNERESQKK